MALQVIPTPCLMMEKLMNNAIQIWQKLTTLLKEDSWQGFIRNALIISGVFWIVIFIFFFLYLPSTTNHGQILTVPDVTGMDTEEAKAFLLRREMHPKIIDSTFNNNFPLNVIASQVPAPNSKVKLDRKIYLVVNTQYAPQVKLPNLLGSSLLNAQQLLASYGLNLGKVTYISHRSDQVLHVFVEGQEFDYQALSEGVLVYQNQQVDLHVADGVGKNRLSMPNLINIPLDEAELHLLGLNLQIGNLRWVPSDKPYGTVLNQRPKPKQAIQEHQSVDLWIANDIQ